MSNQTQNPQNQNRNNDYVDLVTTGIGYINRPRWITPDKGEPYMGCSITAWYGKGGKDTQLFETSVFGQAKDVLNALLQAYPQVADRNAGPKVTVTCGFTIGDGTPDSFTTRKGEHVKCIRGRLFKISWINVNGQRFFTHQDDTDQQGQSQQHGQPPVQQGQPQQYGQPPVQQGQPQQYGQPPVQQGQPQQYGQPPVQQDQFQQYGQPPVQQDQFQQYGQPPVQQNGYRQPVQSQNQQYAHHG